MSLAELLGAFSYALDITEGQPPGHCVRSCWIGSRIGKLLGLSPAEQHDLHFVLLLKDLGCSSNAARICELYEADGAFKQGYKTIGTSLAATLHFVFSRTTTGAPLARRAKAVGNILLNGEAIAKTSSSHDARAERTARAGCASRAAMREQALRIMEGEVGKALDGDCFDALKAVADRRKGQPRRRSRFLL